MKKLKNITRVGALMLLSQLLLIAFMGQWLYSQFTQEKAALQKDLAQQFAETQRQVLDSILLVNIIDPILSRSAGPETKEMRDTLIRRIHPDSTGFKIQINIDSNHTVKKGVFTSAYNETVSIKRSIDREELISDQLLAPKKEGVFIKMQSDTPNAMLLQGVRLILNQVGSSPGSLRTNLYNIDTALFKRTFYKRMQQNEWDFDTTWVQGRMMPTGEKKKEVLYFESNLFPSPYGVKIENYGIFLFRELLPQFLFTIILLLLTGLAFWQSYISLKKQLRLGLLKDDLISNMSHELKTPVATVKVALEALKDYRVMENRVMAEEYLDMATIEINRLDLLMTKVLNSSVMENNNSLFQLQPSDLSLVLDEALQTVRLRIEKQGASLEVEKTGEPFMVMADKLHVQGVILNLIDNSLKYAGPQPAITIALRKDLQWVTLSVADNGPGIPGEYLGKVFDKFFRVPTGDLHNTKGYGLGLSYAAQVMKHHHGEIRAANLPLGGCVFTLQFPVARS